VITPAGELLKKGTHRADIPARLFPNDGNRVSHTTKFFFNFSLPAAEYRKPVHSVYVFFPKVPSRADKMGIHL
jgi:hypothetical protein